MIEKFTAFNLSKEIHSFVWNVANLNRMIGAHFKYFNYLGKSMSDTH